MQRMPDDTLNLDDSGTLDLGRLLTQPQPADVPSVAVPPEFSKKPRQGDTKSRELLTNPFAVPEQK